ncbi:MAG: carboxypeptidase-like regulatory domain-containing protein [Actinomycetota bacterium]
MRTRSRGRFLSLMLAVILACAFVPAFTQTAAAQTGSVSGNVQSSAGGPAVGVLVEAYSEDSQTLYDSTTTDGTGNYQLDDIATPPGTCKVQFAKNDPTFLPEWYNDKDEASKANVIDVEDGAITPNINAVVQVGGSISGTVVGDVGAVPLEGYGVEIYRMVWDAHDYVLTLIETVLTDVDGDYESVTPLNGGSYLIHFNELPGDPWYRGEWYNDALEEEEANPVVVHAGVETPNIDAMLEKGGRISGRVTDTAGADVEDCSVQALQLNEDEEWEVMASGTTNPTGQFVIGPVFGPNCVVFFDPATGPLGFKTQIAEYYNNKGSVDSANPVTLLKGQVKPNVNAALTRAGSISGEIRIDCQKHNYPLFGENDIGILAFRKVGETWTTMGDTKTDENGSYYMGGLAPGQYSVSFTPDRPLWVPEWYNDKPLQQDATIVTVQEAKNTADIDARLAFGTPGSEPGDIDPLPEYGVIDGEFSHYSVVLDGCGLDGAALRFMDLTNTCLMDEFSSVFVSCSSQALHNYDDLGSMSVIKSYLDDGGQLFLSDFAGYRIIEKCWGTSKVEFVKTVEGDAQQGNKQQVTANIVDNGLKSYTGLSAQKITYDKGGWIVVKSAKSGVKKYLTANVQTFYQGQANNSPLSVSFPVGKGTVYYNSFHDDLQEGFGELLLSYQLQLQGNQNRWYLAEGCTNGGMQTWVLVRNPNTTQANVQLTYMTDTGEVAGPSVVIPPESRMTFNVADTCPDRWDVSTMVSSDLSIIAERSVYGPDQVYATESIGARLPSKTWYLAEGCTNGGMETWILVQNPQAAIATVTLTYMTPAGPVPGGTVEIPEKTRKTFNVSEYVPAEYNVSTKVTSDIPVVAERSMFGNGRAWATDSVGVVSKSNNWYLAEGCTNGGMETWILV